jgi:hypothetical protein
VNPELDDEVGPVECLECGEKLPNVGAWKVHIPQCVPSTAKMTTAELDAAYEKALRHVRRR